MTARCGHGGEKSRIAAEERRFKLKTGAAAAAFVTAGLLGFAVYATQTAARIGIGEPTLRDILQELEKPARDPREDMPAPVLRSDVLSMEDLKPGIRLKGTVRNIVDFGAFVDIGVHQDGLVHISKMSRKFIKHPLEAVHVGDVVEVTVLGVDVGKKRISLSMVEDPGKGM